MTKGKKPQLKPAEIWNYRIIIAFADGSYSFDDFLCPDQACVIASRMISQKWRGEKY